MKTHHSKVLVMQNTKDIKTILKASKGKKTDYTSKDS